MKKKFRNIFYVGLTAILSIVLIACGNGETDSGSEANGENGDQVLSGKTVGFSQTNSMSAWRTTQTDSITEAVEEAGGQIIVNDAGGDIATQESNIRDLVASGVDYLVVAPLEANGLQSALQEAMDIGIP